MADANEQSSNDHGAGAEAAFDPFAHNLEEAAARRIVAEACAGAEDGELFFERTRSESLTFDDGRDSQVDVGLPLLYSFGVKATFYPLPEAVGERLEGWKAAAAAGHEIGNHTVGHPSTGNFSWAR